MKHREYDAMAQVESRHWWFVGRRMFLDVFLRRLKAKKLHIADIGAGTGGTTVWLKQYGTVIGVESSLHARALAQKKGAALRKGRAERTGLPSGKFDLVTILDVLYHRNVDEKKALQEAFRMLKKGGCLLVADCALPFLAGPHDEAVFGKKRFMLHEMIRLLKNAGFDVQASSYTFFFVFPFTLLHRLLRKHQRSSGSDVFMPLGFLNTFFLGLCRIEAALLPFVRFPWGSSLVVWSRKPQTL